MKVFKFGGASINTAERIQNAGNILRSYKGEKILVIISAMGKTTNALEKVAEAFFASKKEEALQLFEKAIQSGDTSISVQKYAGLTCLQLGSYDKAIAYFTGIENHINIYSNPGKFYHALTLMKRNLPGDKEKAKELLQSVIDQQLYGNELAAGWIKKM